MATASMTPYSVKSRAFSDAPSLARSPSARSRRMADSPRRLQPPVTTSNPAPRTPRELLQELSTYLHHFDRTGDLGESDTVAEIKRRLRARILEVETELARWKTANPDLLDRCSEIRN